MNITRWLCLLMTVSVLSCSTKTDEELTEDAVRSATFLLNDRKCQEAIDLLEGHGRRWRNADYLQALASSYSCRAGFDEPSFYNNSGNISSSATGFMGSLVQLSTSVMTSPQDNNYQDLKSAIEILSFAGDISIPSVANRAEYFTSDEANDLNVQLLYLVLTQIGKYSFFYGNANPTAGTKAGRAVGDGNPNATTNECFTEYTADDAITIITAGGTGDCDTGGEAGSPFMDKVSLGQTTWVSRMCEGVVLFNNLIDVFNGVILATDLGNVDDLQGNLETVFTTACSAVANGTNLCSVKSQTTCESEYGVDPGDTSSNSGSNLLELYMAAVYEVLFT